jgi:hypothetical protein
MLHSALHPLSVGTELQVGQRDLLVPNYPVTGPYTDGSDPIHVRLNHFIAGTLQLHPIPNQNGETPYEDWQVPEQLTIAPTDNRPGVVIRAAARSAFVTTLDSGPDATDFGAFQTSIEVTEVNHSVTVLAHGQGPQQLYANRQARARTEGGTYPLTCDIVSGLHMEPRDLLRATPDPGRLAKIEESVMDALGPFATLLSATNELQTYGAYQQQKREQQAIDEPVCPCSIMELTPSPDPNLRYAITPDLPLRYKP